MIGAKALSASATPWPNSRNKIAFYGNPDANGDGLANAMERSNAVGNEVVPLAAALAWRTLRAAHAA